MEEQELKKVVVSIIKKELRSSYFQTRKITDTPTDDLEVVNRKYVNLNGNTASRPTSSVLGQKYFDTDLNQPIWVGNGFGWVDANGNPI